MSYRLIDNIIETNTDLNFDNFGGPSVSSSAELGVGFADISIANLSNLYWMLNEKPIGQRSELQVIRNGELIRIVVILGELDG